MKFFLLVTLLAAASASPLSVNQRSRCEDSESHRANITASPFVNIMNVRIDTPEAVYSTPAVVLIGKLQEVVRCKVEDPNVCEVLFNTDSYVYGLHIDGEHVYAGTGQDTVGTLYRCNLNKKDSCKIFQTFASSIMALASEKGLLYVGFLNSKISRCRLNEPNSCRPLHVPGYGISLSSLISFNGNLYAGFWDGRLLKCSLETENSCTLSYDTSGRIEGLSNVNNSLFAATSDGRILNCTEKSDGVTDFCTYVSQTYDDLWDIAYFNDVLYTAHSSNEGISTCKGTNNTECTKFASIRNTYSVAVAYGTYDIQSRFKGEDKSCKWQNNVQCPPLVTYYDAYERALMEVYVQKGKLYKSQGVLVDTSHADQGSSGPAAIFAMGPDGKIVLSNQHKTGLLHTSSLFAGNPVSGAGEIVVENGVIKRISACSDHYQSDVTLNAQVVQSLRSQGYTDPITSVMCGEGEVQGLGQTKENYDP